MPRTACKSLLRLTGFAVLGAMLCSGSSWPSGGAWAFALAEDLTNGTAFPSDDLRDAARWTSRPGSLAADRKRGLGGGIEYAVAGDFCEIMLPHFVDDPKPGCEALLAAIDEAFTQWSDGHSSFRFVDTSEAIAAELPPTGAPDPRRGYGAEIDIIARVPSGFPKPGPFGAETSIYFVLADPASTAGKPISGNTLTSVDIVFNPSKCFFLDPILEQDLCNHFPSLMLHEVGRSLGLGEPDVNPKRNWDNDSHPENDVVIDCGDPLRGLRLSRRVDPQAAMISSRGLAQRVLSGLAKDDIGARNFLYPPCTGQ